MDALHWVDYDRLEGTHYTSRHPDLMSPVFLPTLLSHTYCLRGKFPTVKIGGKNPTLISDVSAHWRCCSYITAPRGKQSLKRTVIRGRFCWTELQTVSSFVDRWPEVRICRGFQAEGFASGAWKEWDGMNGYQGLGRNKVVGTIRATIICPHVTRSHPKIRTGWHLSFWRQSASALDYPSASTDP